MNAEAGHEPIIGKKNQICHLFNVGAFYRFRENTPNG